MIFFALLLVTLLVRVRVDYVRHAGLRPARVTASHVVPELFFGFKEIASDFYLLGLMHDEWLCDNESVNNFWSTSKLIVDLDPHFNFAYRFSALVLMLKLGRPDLTNRVLKLGLRSPLNRSDWRFYFYISSNERFFLGNRSRAERFARLACRTTDIDRNYLFSVPQRPKYLNKLV